MTLLEAQTKASPEPRLDLAGGDVVVFPGAFPSQDADWYFSYLLARVSWRQDTFHIFGRTVRMPRLTAWYGEFSYTYSGIRNDPVRWTEELLDIKARVEKLAGHGFNGALLNLYRDGRDSVSWHNDDEREIGPEPVIGSVSFGATRCFQLRHKKSGERVSVELSHGDVLVMQGESQRHWQHQIPKTARPVGSRINLTFRWHEQ